MSGFCYFVVVCVCFVLPHKGFKCFAGTLRRKGLPSYLFYFSFYYWFIIFCKFKSWIESGQNNDSG